MPSKSTSANTSVARVDSPGKTPTGAICLNSSCRPISKAMCRPPGPPRSPAPRYGTRSAHGFGRWTPHRSSSASWSRLPSSGTLGGMRSIGSRRGCDGEPPEGLYGAAEPQDPPVGGTRSIGGSRHEPRAVALDRHGLRGSSNVPEERVRQIGGTSVKTPVFIALLWGITGCVTVPPLPIAASDAPSTDETSRLRGDWMERDSREKPRRKEHSSGRGTRPSACETAPIGWGQRGPSQKGQQSKRS
jgi:hypothetical protein